MDIIGYISDNVSLTAEKKTAMLDSFCEQYSYQEMVGDPEDEGETIPNPISKKDFANEKIEKFVVDTVNAARLKVGRNAVKIEELDLS